jgi:hypothetical protein
LACNATGSDMLEPLFIGNAAKPRCFGRKSAEDLYFKYYYHNKKAWMTGVIFKDYLAKLDLYFDSIGKKILLIIDNAPSHFECELVNIELLFLPPNCTSICQPLDQGNTFFNFFLIFLSLL